MFDESDVEMAETIISKNERFAPLLNAEHGSKDVWDTIIHDAPNFVVSPTKGSIVPNWVLIIPKHAALNFSQLKENDSLNPFEVLHNTAATLYSGEDWLWFEHGASECESEVGCGVDYAHLHLLLSQSFSFAEFANVVFSIAGDNVWKKTTATEVYNDINHADDYYVFGNKDIAYYLHGKRLGRQFFRRAIAKLSNCADQWDYNLYPFDQNVKLTINALSSHGVAA